MYKTHFQGTNEKIFKSHQHPASRLIKSPKTEFQMRIVMDSKAVSFSISLLKLSNSWGLNNQKAAGPKKPLKTI